MVLNKQQVLDRLGTVEAAGLEGNIVDLGMVSEIFIADGKVYFSLTVPAERAREFEPLREAAERAAMSIPGVRGVMVALTANRAPGSAQAGPGEPPPVERRPTEPASSSRTAPQGDAATRADVPGIRSIIAVASGKGGVGKSTTAVNLALGLSAAGLKVGILDADIYGPSLPRLLGIRGRPAQLENRILKPMENYGLKVMSMGFLVEEDTPMIWRGPMVMSALRQMLREVAWGELDVLVVDMPPGTGDAQLTMAQQVPLAGAVIVSTPQDLALIDARKGLNMFRKVSVPILGLVENMSYFVCPDCGGKHDIFGHGGARREAERIGVPFLGEVPLAMPIRETSDAGEPVVVCAPDGPHAAIYRDIALKVATALEEAQDANKRAAPAILFE